MPSHFIDDWHAHPWHQVIFPLAGLLQSSIDGCRVIVPHNGMLFIPANTTHKSVAITTTQFLTLYLNPNMAVRYQNRAKSCLVSALMKALILLLVEGDLSNYNEQMKTQLLTVLRDQIILADNYEIPLLIPQDRRLLSIFTQLQKQPNLSLTLAQWAQKVGASERTLSRIIAKEFDQSFSLWRQNIRLVLSLQLLEKNSTIQDIALELGYKSDSAYIHAFKGLFMQTPSKYRKGNRKANTIEGDMN